MHAVTISANLSIFNCEDNFFTCVGWWFASFRCPSHMLLRCGCVCCVHSRFVFLCMYLCVRTFVYHCSTKGNKRWLHKWNCCLTNTYTRMIPLLKVTPTCHQSDDWHLRQPIMEGERSWLFMNKTLGDWFVIWFKGYLAFVSCLLLLADSCCGVKCRAIMPECVFIQTPHPLSHTRKKQSKCQLIPVPQPLEFGPSPVTTEETFLCHSSFKNLCNLDKYEAATHFDNKSSFCFSLSRAREASCYERWTVKVKPRAEVREGM